MSSPCGSCQCFPCSCPRVTLEEGRYSFQPHILCSACWQSPCTCNPFDQGTSDTGPSIYCALCYTNPCICNPNYYIQGCGCVLGYCTCGSEVDEFHDMWQHRSEGMRCGTCMWWVEKYDAIREPGVQRLGRCRKHAPKLEGWPAVYDMDWCGDHKLDETKLK